MHLPTITGTLSLLIVLFGLAKLLDAICPKLVSHKWYMNKCQCEGDSWSCYRQLGDCSDRYIELQVPCLTHQNFGCDPGNCLDSCGGMYYLNGSRVCMKECPKGYYEGYTRLCLQCHPDCDGCFGPSNSDCATCRFARLGGSCVSKCPVGYILDISSPHTCIKPDECPGYVLNASCVEQCPDGFYPVDTADTPYCEKCDSLCKTCYSAGTDHCQTCAKFRYGGNCVSVCPMEAPVIHNQDCLAKCPSAKGCATVCGDQFVWHRECVKQCPTSDPYTMNGICVTKCPKLHFERKCVEVCPGVLVQYNGECLNTCPAGYFTDGATCVKKCKHLSYGTSCRDKCPGNLPHFNGKCVYQCPETLHFINPKSRECTSHCPYVIFQNQCLLHCPHGHFWSGHTCSFCDKMCSGCHGPGAQNCETCRYVSYNGVCVRDCPSYTDNKTCVAECPMGKVHLPGKTLCQGSCPDYLPMTADRVCVKECPPDRNFTYQNQCLPKCPRATVFQKDKNSCVDCRDSLYVYKDTCVSQCPFATYSVDRECVRNDGYVLMWAAVTIFGVIVIVVYLIVCRPRRDDVGRNRQQLIQHEEELDRPENTSDVTDNTIDVYHEEHGVENDREPLLACAPPERRRVSPAKQTRPKISEVSDCLPLVEERTCENNGVHIDYLRFQSASTFFSADYTDVVHGTVDTIVHGAARLTTLRGRGSGRPSPNNSIGSEALCPTPESEQNGGSGTGRLAEIDHNTITRAEAADCHMEADPLATNHMYAECTEARKPMTHCSTPPPRETSAIKPNENNSNNSISAVMGLVTLVPTNLTSGCSQDINDGEETSLKHV